MDSHQFSYYQDLSVGSLKTPGNIFLAPLAGFSDASFRRVCISCGASLGWSEMVSAEGLARGSTATKELLRRAAGEEHLVIQLFLSDYTQALRALPSLISRRPSMIDINCGCPVPKVMKTGAGCALMEKPQTMAEIVRALTDSCDIPISIKFRSGADQDRITCFSFARQARQAGASLLTLHPRTRSQGYSGSADWSLLARLKEEIDLPLIGSGDVDSAQRAKEMFEMTGVDGVMIGRGAIGNPFLFSRCKTLLTTGTDPGPPSLEELSSVIFTHLDDRIAAVGEVRSCREMRKHISAYTKGIPGSKQLRGEIVRASTRKEYQEILQKLLPSRRPSSS